jgi:hypothetical protein
VFSECRSYPIIVNSNLVFLDFTTRDKAVDGFTGAFKFQNGESVNRISWDLLT